MTKAKVVPKRGGIYTTEQILNVLDLQDSPLLHFIDEGHCSAVQTSHVTNEELLTVPGFADLKWKYLCTTDEWIPIFHAVSDDDARKCVDIEPWIDPYEDDNGFWVTPKGFPRDQYYKRNDDGEIVRYDDEPVSRPTNQRL